jgi:hypothetical protein
METLVLGVTSDPLTVAAAAATLALVALAIGLFTHDGCQFVLQAQKCL